MTDLPTSSHPAPRSSLGRQLRAAVFLLLIAGGLLGTAYGAYRLTIGRPMLAGERRHDFGNAELGDGPVSLEHTFVLTNNTRRTIEIAGVETTCGCTAADPSTRSIGPGESVEIAATLTLSREGRKKSKIFLHYDANEVDVLYVEGWARNRVRLWVRKGSTRPDVADDLEREIVFIEYDGNDEPPAPVLTPSDGLEATFFGWEQVKSVRSNGWPARWRGRVRVTTTAPTFAPDAAVEVAVGPDQTLRMAVTSGPG
jgi:hypothetical protein